MSTKPCVIASLLVLVCGTSTSAAELAATSSAVLEPSAAQTSSRLLLTPTIWSAAAKSAACATATA